MPVASRSAEKVLPPPDGPKSPIMSGTFSRTATRSSKVRLLVIFHLTHCFSHLLVHHPRWQFNARDTLISRPVLAVHTLRPKINGATPPRLPEFIQRARWNRNRDRIGRSSLDKDPGKRQLPRNQVGVPNT